MPLDGQWSLGGQHIRRGLNEAIRLMIPFAAFSLSIGPALKCRLLSPPVRRISDPLWEVVTSSIGVESENPTKIKNINRINTN